MVQKHMVEARGSDATNSRGTQSTKRDLQISIDRLMAALAQRGCVIKRSAAIEIAAEAFGLRSSNALASAVAEGLMAPVAIRPVGLVDLPDGGSLAVGRDDKGRVFGIAEGLPGSERYVPSPYGGLVDIQALSNLQAPRQADHSHLGQFWATISHRYGTNHYLGATEADRDSQVAAFAREWWGDLQNDIDPSELSNADVIDTYFEAQESEEFLERGWSETSSTESGDTAS